MNDPDTHAALSDMARSIGGLESTVKSLTSTWQAQEEAASSARRELHRKFETLSEKVSGLTNKVEMILGDLVDIKPTVAAVEMAKQRAIGAGLLGKLLWAVGGGLIAAGAWLISHIK